MARKRAPGGGRKPLAPTEPTVKVAITLLASQVEKMQQLGNGNLSAGIRKAIETMKTIAISTGTYTIEQLARLVAAASQRGEWYDGPNSTHIADWIAEGDYTGNETIESLAAEWDN